MASLQLIPCVFFVLLLSFFKTKVGCSLFSYAVTIEAPRFALLFFRCSFDLAG